MILVFMVDHNPRLAMHRAGIEMLRSCDRGLTMDGIP